MSRLRRVLVANRGEIARRVFRALRQQSISCAAIYTDADARAPHAREADVAVRVDSYLDIEGIIAAATALDADAIHPGYGFLSERAEFSQACQDNGIVFIGPSPAAIDAMGDKGRAKALMAKAGVPVVPGAGDGPTPLDLDQLAAAAPRVGYPLLVKARAGGGGRGMRLVREASELRDALERASAEAQASFGDGALILERYIENGRHVEVQVFGDAQGTVTHFSERDCSAQRRHQKVIEEAPSPAVNPELRAAMGEAAVAAAKAIDYLGAGTVEFLLADDGSFFFLEMNTRLQVEHPVTELATGTDLVELQLEVAAGIPIGPTAHTPHFAAIEARIYAEDPDAGFMPQVGTIVRYAEPPPKALTDQDAVIRVDSGIEQGQTITADYDPMLLKLIASGKNREHARVSLLEALESLVLFGPRTNAGFLHRLLSHPTFIAGDVRTQTLEALVAAGDLVQPPRPDWALALAVVACFGPHPTLRTLDSVVRLREDGVVRTVRFNADCVRVDDGESMALGPIESSQPDRYLGEIDGVRRRFGCSLADDGTLFMQVGAETYALSLYRPAADPPGAAPDDPSRVVSPAPGKVIEVHVEIGQSVEAGQALVTVEAMKIQSTIVAQAAGSVAELNVENGRAVAAGAVLVVLSLPEESS